MSNAELLDRAAGATMCQIMGSIGSSLVGASVLPLWTPKGQAIALGLGSLSLLASNYLCPPIEVGDDDPLEKVTGCSEVCSCGTLWYFIPETVPWQPFTYYGAKQDYFKKITGTEVNNRDGTWATDIYYLNCDNQVGTYRAYHFDSEYIQSQTQWKLVDNNDLGCCEGDRDTHPLPPDFDQPVVYNDPVTNCTYNVSLQGFVQPTPDGPVQPVLRIEGAVNSGGGSTRAEGGVIGGCNFSPVIYMPNPDGGGGGPTIPEPPNPPPPDPDGRPWWVDPLITSVTTVILNQLVETLNDLFPPTLPAATASLLAPCDFDEEGNQLSRTWEIPEASAVGRLNQHQVVIMQMLQQHLDWKTPICGSDDGPTPEGQFRTISFRSETTSPYGKSRLRKRLRYRSNSGIGLSGLIDHWADFTFTGGPVRVQHLGSSWGTVEVWAASEDEGKRVIRHAAGEAGIDPDQVGRWSTRSSNSSRLGVSLPMRVDTTGGYYWITERDGSDNRPTVGRTSPDQLSGADK